MSLTHLPAFSPKPASPKPAVRLGAPERLISGNLASVRVGDRLTFAGSGSIRQVGCTAEEAQTYLPRLREARAHAREAGLLYANTSGRHYGAIVVLDNGIEALGTNIEASRQCTLCDLRLGIAGAVNRHIAESRQAKSEPGQKARALQLEKTAKVAEIFLANADPDGEAPIPCSDCQEWLNSDFCTRETRLVSLEPDPENTPNELVRVRTVGEMLPLHKGRDPVRFVTELPLDHLLAEAQWSDQARGVLEAMDDPKQRARLQTRLARMITRARKAYLTNESANDSRLRTGVSAMVSPFNLVMSGGRFDWTTRWFEAADLKVASSSFQFVQLLQGFIQNSLPGWLSKRLAPLLEPPRIKALAYYGDDPSLPPIPSLGRIGRRRGGSDTLVLTVENDKLQVRTIGDFMPEMYQTRPKA